MKRKATMVCPKWDTCSDWTCHHKNEHEKSDMCDQGHNCPHCKVVKRNEKKA